MQQPHTLHRLPRKLDYNYHCGMQYGLIHWGEGWDVFRQRSSRRFSNGIIMAIIYGFRFHHQGNTKGSRWSYIVFYATTPELLHYVCCIMGTFIHQLKQKERKQRESLGSFISHDHTKRPCVKREWAMTVDSYFSFPFPFRIWLSFLFLRSQLL